MSMNHKPSVRGFTLIELIVSVGIFSIVMLVATSAYLTLIRLDRRARATNQIVNNLSFAMDAMVRGIRTGSDYHCINGAPDASGNSTSGACTQFYYTDSNLATGSNVVTFFLDGTKVMRNEGAVYSTSVATASLLTDPSITVSSLVFYVRGAGTSNDAQPQVLFTLKGSMPADASGDVTTFTIQEGATARVIDL